MADNDFGNPEAFFARHGGRAQEPRPHPARPWPCCATPPARRPTWWPSWKRSPAISSKVLKAANSAFYGTPKSITSLKAAIVRLGNHNVARIALSASLGAVGGGRLGRLLEAIPFPWPCSRATSAGSRARYTRQEEEELFSMGLLHDLGAMVELDSRRIRARGGRPSSSSSADPRPRPRTWCSASITAAWAAWSRSCGTSPAISSTPSPATTSRNSKDFYRKAIVIHLADLVCHGFHSPGHPRRSRAGHPGGLPPGIQPARGATRPVRRLVARPEGRNRRVRGSDGGPFVLRVLVRGPGRAPAGAVPHARILGRMGRVRWGVDNGAFGA